MSMLCRSYATADDARAAVSRLLAAGVTGDAVRVVMGEPPRDARQGRHGGYAGSAGPGVPVGEFAGMPRTDRQAMGAYAGEFDAQRRGSYADADRDTVTSFPRGVATERVASHRTLAGMLRDAGLEPTAVDDEVRAVHAGRVLVLVDDGVAPAATSALDAD
jgi:hypothetical protein